MTLDRGAPLDGVATIDTGKDRPSGRCLGCDWTRVSSDGSDWLMIRAAARRHVATTGHRVSVSVTNVYQYGRPRRPRP